MITPASVVGAMALVLALGACGNGNGDEKDEAATTTATPGAVSGNGPVQIVGFQFKLQNLRAKAGTKVTWTNEDTAVHSIKDTSPLATPISPDLAQGATFSITYDRPGTYSYICGIHQYMTGSVEVVT